MGKGDPRTRRGKIFKGTYGKKRPKPSKLRQAAKVQASQSAPTQS